MASCCSGVMRPSATIRSRSLLCAAGGICCGGGAQVRQLSDRFGESATPYSSQSCVDDGGCVGAPTLEHEALAAFHISAHSGKRRREGSRSGGGCPEMGCSN